MEATVRPFALELDAPLETADGAIRRRRGLLVRVEEAANEAADPAVGLGEATPLPGWTESFEAARTALADAAQVLRCEGPDAALGVLRGAPAARHALQLALADLRARRAGVPLASHLAAGDEAGPSDHVPVNATVGDGSPDETARAARQAADAGFDCVKVKVGVRDAAADTGRLGAVREAVGSAVELRADANGAWTRAQAYEAVRNYPTAGVAVVEQPLEPSDIRGHAGLRGNGVDVALDETVAQVGVDDVLAADAADVVVLKPMALGGVDRARAAALDALESGVDIVVSNTVDAVVARTAAGHLAASLPEVRACGLATADRLADDLAADPAPVERGRLRVPDDEGTGVDVDAAWAGAAGTEVADRGDPTGGVEDA